VSDRWPRLLRGGLVLLDPDGGSVMRTVALQYNPDTLSRTLQIQGAAEGSGHSDVLRLKGPPVETIKLEAEIDAADFLEHPDKYPDVAQVGIHPQLAALETIVYPSTDQIRATRQLADRGTLEVVAPSAPLTVFVWSSRRVVPVRITELSVTEEAFDPNLNPIRAKVSLGMRVLSSTDLGFVGPGSAIFGVYHRGKERLAASSRSAALAALGLKEPP
jgi:hypothetical protein